MTIREALYFQYGTKRSIDFGILNVNISSGMLEEPFAASRSINEINVRGRDKPYFQNIKKEPLKFTVSFAFEDTWDKDKLREVTRWLTEVEYYQPLTFSSNNERIYYAIAVDDATLVHNSLQQGYINLSFRCNDAYAYSPIYEKEYVWNETTLDITVDEFDDGTDINTSLDENNKLILNTNRPKWSDLSSALTWMDY